MTPIRLSVPGKYDCQIMTLGGRVVGEELAKTRVDIWLASDYEGGRSAPKVEAHESNR
jgi:ribose 5-phosphate isomerase RpiB